MAKPRIWTPDQPLTPEQVKALFEHPPRALRRALSHTRGRPVLVRNVETGRVLPCNWADCERPGDDRIQISIPHNAPRWRTLDGQCEQLIYVFCSERHRAYFARGTHFERYL